MKMEDIKKIINEINDLIELQAEKYILTEEQKANNIEKLEKAKEILQKIIL